ncbi:MAG: exopolysaccharide biosynthesis protein [Alphaproteobacteria bacterium]|nr:exopolysaccharide biosynthesis protein [Alphaproteobacteria bacterium]|tara:strand:+ start:3942 stop:4532 length:591 start_codon:yes stop_codon:yes gene_type:complete
MARVNNLGTLLRSLEDRTSGDKVSVEAMLNAVGRRSYGPILLLLGFIALSPLTIIPGANWLVALIILLMAGQILFGKKYPWLPSRVLNFEFPRSALIQGIEIADPYVCQIDRFLKPRFAILTEPPFVQLVALVCIGAALVTFPLGLIPFGPVLPSLTVLLFGLALTSRDGVVLMLAGAALCGSLWLMIHLWARLFG